MSTEAKSYHFKSVLLDALIFTYLFLVFASILVPIFSDVSFDEAFMTEHMGALALITLILSLVSAFLTIALNRMQIHTLGEVLFAPPHIKTKITERPLLKSFWGWQVSIAFIVTFLLSLKTTEFSIMELLDADGIDGAIRLFQGLATPNFDILPQAIIKIFETIFIAFLATMIAIPIAFVMSFVCAKNVMTHPAAFATYTILRTLLNITRSIEPLIWAIIFSVWVGIGPFAGMLALMIHSIASLTKQYSEIVESVSHGPIEGIQSTGANMVQVIWFAIVPQVILPYIAFTIYRWDINVRMATIIGLVGGGGIGTMLIKYQGQAMWHEVGCIIIVIAAVVWIMDAASAYIREAIK